MLAAAGIFPLLFLAGAGCAGRGAAETGPSAHEHGDAGEHGHGDEHALELSESQLDACGVRLARAGSGVISTVIELPGEVRLNPDRVAHVGPAAPGVVTRVLKSLGESVKTGETLAVLRSRELSELRSARLIAAKRVELAEKAFQREETLWKEHISSERDYLEAGRDLEEARIALLDASQKLEALGFGKQAPEGATGGETALNEYRLVSPLDGVVIEKHLTPGETLADGEPAFTVADLSRVWAVFSIYRKDLSLVREGMEVTVSQGDGLEQAVGVVSYVGPLLGEETRTGAARVVLDNSNGVWKPGLFVTGRIVSGEQESPLTVETGALLGVEGSNEIFVRTEKGFELRKVATGRRDASRVEILEGLAPGEEYVAAGAFTLRSELMKESFAGEGHSH